jgi:hypothetical protein
MTAGRQKPRQRNDCEALGCEELCLLVPGGARCACRQGFGLNGTLSSCVRTNDATLEAGPGKEKSKSTPAIKVEESSSGGGHEVAGGNVTCGAGEVACSSGAPACVSRLLVCDGDVVS